MEERNPIDKIIEDITTAYNKYHNELTKAKKWDRIKKYKEYNNLRGKKYEKMGDKNKNKLKELQEFFKDLSEKEERKLKQEIKENHQGINNTKGNAESELIKNIKTIYDPKSHTDYYKFFEAVHKLPKDLKNEFIGDFGEEIRKAYKSEQTIDKMTLDFKGKDLDVLDDFGDNFRNSIKQLTYKIMTPEELQEATDKVAEEARIKGKQEYAEQLKHAPEKIDLIYKDVKDIKEVFNPEPVRDKEGNISAHSLLRNSKSLNKIQEYLSRGFGDLSQDVLMDKLKKYTKGDDKEAKAYADAIMIRKAEQQARNKPLYQRLKEARDASLIRNIPEEVQKDLNDYEREDFAKQMRDVHNYYLLPHEWKTIKATRDYGINPMLLRGIIKE